MGRQRQKTGAEMTELDHLQEENDRLQTEGAYLAMARGQLCRHLVPNSWTSLAGLSVTRLASNG